MQQKECPFGKCTVKKKKYVLCGGKTVAFVVCNAQMEKS